MFSNTHIYVFQQVSRLTVNMANRGRVKRRVKTGGIRVKTVQNRAVVTVIVIVVMVAV